MIEPIVYIGIGFLSSALVAACVVPLLHARKVGLSKRRLQEAHQLLAKVRADKNLLRAEFARSTRDFEVLVEQLNNKIANLRIESGKHEDIVNQLKFERSALKLEVEGLRVQAQGVDLAQNPLPEVKPVPMFLPLEARQREQFLEPGRRDPSENRFTSSSPIEAGGRVTRLDYRRLVLKS